MCVAVSGTRCPAGTEDAVSTAYDQVFTRSLGLTAEQRAARLDHGDAAAVRALLDAWLATPQPSSTTITVNGVECRGPARAVVDGDLNLAGVPLQDVLAPGRAVRRDGTWKVTLPTFCARMVLENPALADAGVCAKNARRG